MNKTWEQLEEMYLRTTTRSEESTMIGHYRAYAIKAREELDTADKAYKWMDETYKGALAENDALRKFAKAMIIENGSDWIDDLDGDYIQEKALKFGLLIETTQPERCGDHCLCAEYDADFPTVCYRATDLLKGKV